MSTTFFSWNLSLSILFVVCLSTWLDSLPLPPSSRLDKNLHFRSSSSSSRWRGLWGLLGRKIGEAKASSPGSGCEEELSDYIPPANSSLHLWQTASPKKGNHFLAGPTETANLFCMASCVDVSINKVTNNSSRT